MSWSMPQGVLSFRGLRYCEHRLVRLVETQYRLNLCESSQCNSGQPTSVAHTVGEIDRGKRDEREIQGS